MTSISRNKRRAKRGQADPRYNKGIFVNAAGQRREKAAQALADTLFSLPTLWGWTRAYWHDELNQQVYQMGSVKMVFLHPQGEWFVDFGDAYPIWYTGSQEKIAADVKREIAVRIDRLAAQWEAAHPDFDSGVA